MVVRHRVVIWFGPWTGGGWWWLVVGERCHVTCGSFVASHHVELVITELRWLGTLYKYIVL